MAHPRLSMGDLPVPPSDLESVVSTTQACCAGPADEIHRTIWGDNIHLGVPCGDESPHPEAMKPTNEIMEDAVKLGPGTRVLDWGCGYGSTARYLAAISGCSVTGTNISERELEVARVQCGEAALGHLLTFEYGGFCRPGFPDCTYDVVWSQEAFLHAAEKTAVLLECRRVLRPGATLIFTDILVRRNAQDDERARIYQRAESPDMWDIDDCRDALSRLEFFVDREEGWSHQVARSFAWVKGRLHEQRDSLALRIGSDTIDHILE